MIGIDGSPQSDAALEWAIGLAKPLSRPLHPRRPGGLWR
ncbi:MAG: universal stress protein [Candidatus Dormibacteraeota bacterium]|uniref:Universal stress protein n=1 Tax=Candidatus Aeolococcus gillhamiae TaxID=3127015 RepID=A0A934K419_9BACT|nr:universal stress protein [Candidatus Dormibacteraeota bacterium]